VLQGGRPLARGRDPVRSIGRGQDSVDEGCVVSRPGAPWIAVVDYGAGNLASLGGALDRVGARWRLADGPSGLEGAAAIVLPGVGAAAPAMRALASTGLDRALVEAEAPLLGERGDQVLIRVEADGVAASMTGEALQSGSKGEGIRVRNHSSGKVITAWVVERGIVETRF